MDWQTVVVASVQGIDLSLHELLHDLKLKGRLRPLLTEAILDKVVAHAIVQEGIQVSTEELKKAADAFRIRRGLHKAAALQNWLASNDLTPEECESGLERALLSQKLADKVVPRQAVEKYFAENGTRFDRARLLHLVVDKEGLANELLSQLQDDGADFAEMVRKHSQDEQTRGAGGRLGIVPRNRLTPVMESAVFNARKGDVVGPFRTNGGFDLLKVEDTLLGQLDQKTAAAIQRVLFHQWVREQARTARIEVKLHQHL